MFKNYLTYNMALSFHRSCLIIPDLNGKIKDRLMRSSETMLQHFSSALYATDKKERAKFYYVTLVALRDCRSVLLEAKVDYQPLYSQFEVLHGRLEQICLDFCTEDSGQLRMLG